VSIKYKIIFRNLRGFLSQFVRHRVGMFGAFLLSIFLIISILAPFITEHSPREWHIAPRMAPPTWVIQGKKAPSGIIEVTESDVRLYKLNRVMNVTVRFKYDYDLFPSSFSTKIKVKLADVEGIPPELKKVICVAYLKKPSNTEIPILKVPKVIEPGAETQISISSRSKDLKLFLNSYFNLTVSDPETKVFPAVILFADMDKSTNPYDSDSSVVEKGYYEVIFTFMGYNVIGLEVKETKVQIEGVTFGLMGSDGEGRDVWSLLVWGTPIAFAIGVLSSIVSTAFGVIYGIISGYIGGKVDEVMMRIVDILIAIPKIPILIIIAFLYRPSVWTIVLLIGFLGWMGISRVSRSMCLQFKEMTFVEASKVLGAGKLRIMFRHILPNILPYAYASLALGVPDAILTEASLSFLGLGDPTAPTWGLILYWARLDQAFFKGAWWTVIPPGLAIALLSVSFIFIGHALNEILNPRIKRL